VGTLVDNPNAGLTDQKAMENLEKFRLRNSSNYEARMRFSLRSRFIISYVLESWRGIPAPTGTLNSSVMLDS